MISGFSKEIYEGLLMYFALYVLAIVLPNKLATGKKKKQ